LAIEESRMFTGIIETVGKVIDIKGSRTGGFTLKIRPEKPLKEIKIGDSISISGVCLTVVDCNSKEFYVFVSKETFERTHFGNIKIGDIVNLETALHLGSSLSGHLVQGHIDDTGIIRALKRVGEAVEMVIEVRSPMIKYVSPKGSIAVEGVSLTVNAVSENSFSVMLIPYTLENTNLRYVKVGNLVNIEVDIIAKYVESLVKGAEERPKGEITEELLFEHGFIEGE